METNNEQPKQQVEEHLRDENWEEVGSDVEHEEKVEEAPKEVKKGSASK